ncbi:NMD4 [Candida pseudojiufengensis]|uniref:NMD4 n=1 Tax=Candida pseudojiufengensis TaxID=497109 RepID=UPI002224E518|nr:NMD4 [Candida pseudojiufengensis]KAI5960141.1 NMD4 [Candida pseudojiufengensis]
MSQDYDSDPSERFLQDELMDSINNGSKNGAFPNITQPNDSKRQVKLILDQTAFVRGIGNIKRWFNDDYINSNFNKNSEPILLELHIPSYTLHEFEFVKKGTSISATNAREAIKFIDNHLENYNYQYNTPNNHDNHHDEKKITYNVNLETPNDSTPSWNSCLKYKVYSPKIKDFPNYKTRFDSSLLRQLPSQQDDAYENDHHKYKSKSERKNSFHDDKFQIHYENSPSYQNALEHSDSYAEMPPRLKYLLRTCIYKRFLEKPSSNHQKPWKSIEEWKLVTEDSITKIWAQSFGIDCVNVNEAELLIFQNYDVNSFKIYNPFALNDDDFEFNNVLQSKIDTTELYQYQKMDQTPPKIHHKSNTYRGRRKQSNKAPKTYISTEGAVHEEPDYTSANGFIKKEKFQAINYAPRGHGQLWRP